ncbi:uncharacterized protein LOC110875885 [Helianthus annuus]|uniref:uncharacterized protein LOC110875885 n=1 Tax=Helianthus annuus TaxID=4232 RepID=UPI000B9029CD|nr:uncharacterized protein LOC110875885 [Helianthus annuus]
MWLLLGDFNDVRKTDERMNSRFDSTDAAAFNDFISRVGLMEFNMQGGKFTYVSDNGTKLSKLDCFLVCDSFMAKWPTSNLRVLRGGLSDHLPIYLECSNMDFGPIPFKMFNMWTGKETVNRFVAQQVAGVDLNAPGDSALYKVLRMIKADIKKWRESVRMEEEKEYESIAKGIEELESKAETTILSPVELEQRASLLVKLKAIEHEKCLDLQQKARIKWVQFGDENSAFFHRAIKINITTNRIQELIFNGVRVRDPVALKVEVKKWFRSLFAESMRRRPKFSNLGLPVLSTTDSASLVASFSSEEVWRAIKECDGS